VREEEEEEKGRGEMRKERDVYVEWEREKHVVRTTMLLVISLNKHLKKIYFKPNYKFLFITFKRHPFDTNDPVRIK
jgi:hypothetical protein